MSLRVSLFAMLLAAAGLPLYIHLPRFATTELGLSLGAVGALLIGLRAVDFLQDPLLGWLVDRYPQARARFAALATLGMGFGFALLYALRPSGLVMLWLSLALVLIFTAYSLASILFYGQTVALAGSATPEAVYRLAAFREAGTLAGIILAALAPVILAAVLTEPLVFPAFGLTLALAALLIGLATRGLWQRATPTEERLSLAGLRASGGLKLLFLSFVNALPVAITSTLFLFFVSDRLALPDLAGPFLILFFLAAGLSVPLWSRLVQNHGARQVLLPAMSLAIASFVGAALLPSGAAALFALICLASGAALGADMVILPALFARRLAAAGLQAGQAFGLWSFAAKAALALAAGLMLPLLDLAGFQPGTANTASALTALGLAYALLPCLIKIFAIWLVYTLPREDLS